jgi:hypothetical protein
VGRSAAAESVSARAISFHTQVAQAAAAMLEASADPDARGLVLRGREHQPLLVHDMAPDSAQGVAARGLLRLATLAEELIDGPLFEHPSPSVRRAVAVLAARAHPLRVGLEGVHAMAVPRVAPPPGAPGGDSRP